MVHSSEYQATYNHLGYLAMCFAEIAVLPSSSPALFLVPTLVVLEFSERGALHALHCPACPALRLFDVVPKSHNRSLLLPAPLPSFPYACPCRFFPSSLASLAGSLPRFQLFPFWYLPTLLCLRPAPSGPSGRKESKWPRQRQTAVE
ncbi:hypothetical protein Mapa_013787 [Marchantia paleacea]|nr:hypothetical protein Mapa_013787 [Marchantia paleacea]